MNPPHSPRKEAVPDTSVGPHRHDGYAAEYSVPSGTGRVRPARTPRGLNPATRVDMQTEPDPGRPAGPENPGPGVTPNLAKELTGPLPCLVCRYNLRGLSVRAVCPECGTPVRATILATVDPYAGVLRPLAAPRITAAGLLVWPVAALAAAMLTWCLRLADAYAVFTTSSMGPTGGVVLAATGCILLSAVASLVLIRPHGGIPRWQIAGAAVGSLATVVLGLAYYELHGVYDRAHLKPYFVVDGSEPERSLLRLLISLLFLVALVGLRPNARLLAARSLLLRMGRVDRQTLLAMAAAIGVASVGDLVHLLLAWGSLREGVLDDLGDFLIAVGSMLLTVGLVGMVVDCWRTVPVLLRPPLALHQIVGDTPGRPAGDGAGGVGGTTGDGGRA